MFPSEETAAQTAPLSLGPGREFLAWLTFFLICFGLGYPTLNRYDPEKLLPDSGSYFRMVTDGPGSVSSPMRFRILEPYMVRPIYRIARGRVGSWNPLCFGFLVVNSLFVAGSAQLISAIGRRIFKSYSIALAAVGLYLLNFAVSNAQLAGLVDASEAFFLAALVAALFFRRWWLLPLLGIAGALAKESFVPFSVTMAAVWLLFSEKSRADRIRGAWWVGTMAVIELTTTTLVQSSISGHLIWPWSFAAGLDSHANHALEFFVSLADKDSWFVLIWLLPLGLLGIRRLPRPDLSRPDPSRQDPSRQASRQSFADMPSATMSSTGMDMGLRGREPGGPGAERVSRRSRHCRWNRAIHL